jgi:hypothetical protein
MMSKRLSLAATLAAASMLAATAAVAQSGQASKPSPYEGVSTPPPDSTILTNDSASPAPAAAATAPAPAPARAPYTSAPASAAVPSATPAPAATDAAATDGSGDVALQRRPAQAVEGSREDLSPADGIVSYLAGPPNALPEGTVFHVTMLDTVLADQTAPGTPFHARLNEDLSYGGNVVIPAGSELRGRVVTAVTSRRIAGRSMIHLRADEFVLPNGQSYPLHAEVIDTMGSDTKVSGEGNIVSEAHAKRAALELAATSGSGAVVGAVVAGPVGAAVGSTVGAGFIGAHYLLAIPTVDVPQNSTLIFSLTDPMFLTPAPEQR